MKRCFDCYNFAFLPTDHRVGVCRLKTPRYDPGLTPEGVAYASADEGYPLVQRSDWCADFDKVEPTTDLQIGGYVLVSADCFDKDNSLVIPQGKAGLERLYRVLGCQERGYYEVIGTNMRRAYYDDDTCGVVRHEYPARNHSMAEAHHLTRVYHRFRRGDCARLAHNIFTRVGDDAELDHLPAKTVLTIREVLDGGSYKVTIDDKRFRDMIAEAPDSVLEMHENVD